MIKELYHAFQGRMIWKRLCRKYGIDSSCVTIVLAEDDALWNACALRYLPAFMKWKSANHALILVKNGIHIDTGEGKNEIHTDIGEGKKEVYTDTGEVKNGVRIKIGEAKNTLLKRIKEKEAEYLLSYYTLFRFSDNLVFFYTKRPQDNRSEFALKHTEVTMDELICLGLYHLREVPQYV